MNADTLKSKHYFNTYAETLSYLDGLGMFHVDLSLDRVGSALEMLGVKRLPCPAVQVVGTNGKGSTCAFLHSLAMAHGLRSGLYTSPHFVSPRERIRINDCCLPEAAWPGFASQVYSARPDLTYFEMLTVIAALAFNRSEPDVVFLEAGLGGQHDATTALDADLVCFTPIAMDHTEILGNDLVDIAADKAGALRTGVRAAVCSPQSPEAGQILRSKAAGLKIPLLGLAADFATRREPDDIPLQNDSPEFNPEDMDTLLRGKLGLQGLHQKTNARTAVTAWLTLCRIEGWKTNPHSIRLGLERAFIPGRWQEVRDLGDVPAILLDGAHNPHGMLALKNALQEKRITPPAIIFSCLMDKNPHVLSWLIREMAPRSPVFCPTISNNARAMSGEALAEMIGENARACATLRTALQEAAQTAVSPQPILICGSLYLLAEFYSLYPQALKAENCTPAEGQAWF